MRAEADMPDYKVVGKFDAQGFPTGAHLLLEGTEHTLCGLVGEMPGSRFYPILRGEVDCAECIRLIAEVLTIEEPVEFG